MEHEYNDKMFPIDIRFGFWLEPSIQVQAYS
jgi:hypothetical protein